MRGQVGVEGFALDELHGEEVASRVLPAVVDGNDVGMAQARGEFDFTLEAAAFGLAGERSLADDFDGHGTLGAHLLGLVDHALAAAADFLDQLEPADPGHGADGLRRLVCLGLAVGVREVTPESCHSRRCLFGGDSCVDEVEVVEEGSQLGGKVRVLAEVLFLVGALAVLDPGQEVFDQGVERTVAPVRRIHDSVIAARSCLRALLKSMQVAPWLRPSWAATSLRGRCSSL